MGGWSGWIRGDYEKVWFYWGRQEKIFRLRLGSRSKQLVCATRSAINARTKSTKLSYPQPV